MGEFLNDNSLQMIFFRFGELGLTWSGLLKTQKTKKLALLVFFHPNPGKNASLKWSIV